MAKMCSLYFDASQPLILPPPAIPAGGTTEGKDPTADALGMLKLRRDDTMIDVEEVRMERRTPFRIIVIVSTVARSSHKRRSCEECNRV